MAIPALLPDAPAMTSELRPVPNFPGIFASDDGHVFFQKKTGRLVQLKERTRPDGYRTVNARSADGFRQPRMVHRLVAAAWHGAPAGPETVTRHLDSDRANNKPSNLRFGTAAQNSIDAKQAGRIRKGEGHPNARLTEQDVAAIKHAVAMRVPRKTIAAHWGISRFTVRDIANGRSWRSSAGKAA